MRKDEPALSVQHLSKEFDVSATTNYRNPLEKQKLKNSIKSHQFALKDISFDVYPGEIVGLIGRNGSGKSTLLKLISGLLHPTKGRIAFNGKIVSILELGSGFHPDLSGIENIMFTADLLGIPKMVIKKRVPEIVKFSQIGNYINLPIKYYSQGMYLRLAFSIMTVLDFDIMLLDEIIGVADENFKDKSQRTILKWMRSNKTMILATHDINFALNYTSKCLLLENGHLVEFGSSKKVLTTYFTEHINFQEEQEESDPETTEEETGSNASEENQEQEQLPLNELQEELQKEDDSHLPDEQQELLKDKLFVSKLHEMEQDNDVVKVTNVSINSDQKKLETSHGFNISISYEKFNPVPTVMSTVFNYISFQNVMGAFPFRSHNPEKIVNDRDTGKYVAEVELPPFLLNAGIYSLDIVFANYDNELIEHLRKVIFFEINNTKFTVNGYTYDGAYTGPVAPKLNWSLKQIKGS